MKEVPSLHQFRAELERRRQDAQRMGATARVSDVLTAVLEDLGTVTNGDKPDRPTSTPDRLLSAREVAERIGVSPRYVYAHRRDFPFTRELPGGTIRFSEAGLARWMAKAS